MVVRVIQAVKVVQEVKVVKVVSLDSENYGLHGLNYQIIEKS